MARPKIIIQKTYERRFNFGITVAALLISLFFSLMVGHIISEIFIVSIQRTMIIPFVIILGIFILVDNQFFYYKREIYRKLEVSHNGNFIEEKDQTTEYSRYDFWKAEYGLKDEKKRDGTVTFY